MSKKNFNVNIVRGSEFLQFIIMTILLFAFWLIMSGQFELQLMIIGFTASLAVAWLTRPLMRLPSMNNPDNVYLAFYFSFFKLVSYWFWLLKEVVKSNIYLTKLILNPKLTITPTVVTFKKNFDNPLAHFTLGNSITLTPGTVTLAIEDDVYYIHAITQEAGLEIAPPDGQEAEMAKRVTLLFGE